MIVISNETCQIFLVGPVVRGQGVMVLNWKEGRFRLDLRREYFTLKVVKHWHRFPREVADESIQGEVGWGFDQSDLVEDVLQGWLQGCWTRWNVKVLSNPKHSMSPYKPSYRFSASRFLFILCISAMAPTVIRTVWAVRQGNAEIRVKTVTDI